MYNNIWCNFVILLIFIIAVPDASSTKEKIKISGLTKGDTYEYDHESIADFVCSYTAESGSYVNISWIWKKRDMLKMYYKHDCNNRAAVIAYRKEYPDREVPSEDKNGNEKNLLNSQNCSICYIQLCECSIQDVVGEKNAGDKLTCVTIEIPEDTGDVGGGNPVHSNRSISFKYKPPATSTASSSPASYTETAYTIVTPNDLDGGNNTSQSNIIYIACAVFILVFLAILISCITCIVNKKKRKTRSTNEVESVHNTTVNTKSLTKTNRSDQTRLAPNKHKETEVNEVYSEVKDSINQSIYTAPQSVYSDPNIQNIPEYSVVLPKSERNKNTPEDNVYTYVNPSCSYKPRKNYVNIISGKSKYVNFETNGRNADYCNAYESVQRNVKNGTGYYEADYL